MENKIFYMIPLLQYCRQCYRSTDLFWLRIKFISCEIYGSLVGTGSLGANQVKKAVQKTGSMCGVLQKSDFIWEEINESKTGSNLDSIPFKSGLLYKILTCDYWKAPVNIVWHMFLCKMFSLVLCTLLFLLILKRSKS